MTWKSQDLSFLVMDKHGAKNPAEGGAKDSNRAKDMDAGRKSDQ